MWRNEQIDWLEKSMLVLLLLGGLLNIYLFFLPYNTIADEEEYLSEVFSIIYGDPQGWNIRSFAYPLLLSPLPLLSKWLGFDSPAEIAFTIRLSNWIVSWLAIWLVFTLGNRFYNRKTGLLAAVIMLFSWFWLLSARRMMMDVPSATFLLAAIYFITRPQRSDIDIVLATTAGALSTFTKFQMGIAVTPLLAMLLVQEALAHHWHRVKLIISSCIALLLLFSLIDWVVYGWPLTSLVEFFKYNFANSAEFKSKYGECKPLSYYLTGISDLYSHIFPWLIACGIILSFFRWRLLLPCLLTSGAYLAVMHAICHKQSRYLIQIAPLLALFGSHAIIWLSTKAAVIFDYFRISIAGRANDIATLAIILIVIVTFVPRNELENILTLPEACSDFIYELVDSKKLAGVQTLALGVPCGIPAYPIKQFKLVYGDLGFNAYTRAKALNDFKQSIATVDAAIVERNNPLEHILLEQWNEPTPIVLSQYGKYALYYRPKAQHPDVAK